MHCFTKQDCPLHRDKTHRTCPVIAGLAHPIACPQRHAEWPPARPWSIMWTCLPRPYGFNAKGNSAPAKAGPAAPDVYRHHDRRHALLREYRARQSASLYHFVHHHPDLGREYGGRENGRRPCQPDDAHRLALGHRLHRAPDFRGPAGAPRFPGHPQELAAPARLRHRWLHRLQLPFSIPPCNIPAPSMPSSNRPASRW